jgi:hypothetical protein
MRDEYKKGDKDREALKFRIESCVRHGKVVPVMAIADNLIEIAAIQLRALPEFLVNLGKGGIFMRFWGLSWQVVLRTFETTDGSRASLRFHSAEISD